MTEDLTGLKFGNWTVMYRAPNNKRRGVMWHCICSCEKKTERDIPTNNLKMKKSQSCGCLRNKQSSDRRKIDLTLQQFGRLTALEPVGQDKKGNVLWLCVCSCPDHNLITRPAEQLRSRHVQSCGCLQKEVVSKRSKQDLTGLVFGRLTVLCEYEVNKKTQNATWLCECICGNFTMVPTSLLNNKAVRSCGCLQKDEMAKRQGDKHPNWKGGTKYLPYCPRFNEKKKKEVRDKFNNKCILCGKSKEENGQNLSVHHVDYNKDQGCNGHNWVLVPLCSQCHGKIHGNINREQYWENIINNLLSWRVINI